MTFGSTFGRVFSPTFQPKSQAAVAGGGWWDLDGTITSCVAAYQAKGAADIAASYVNLVNPGTNNASAGNAPSFDSAIGWTFNGTTNYLLISGTLPLSDSPLTMVARVIPNDLSGQRTIMSVHNSSNYNRLVLLKELTSNRVIFYNGGTALLGSTVALQSGVANSVAGVETSDTSHATFVDGANKGTSGTSAALAGLNVGLIGARNNGSVGLLWSGVIECCALYNAALSDANVAALHTAMAAL